MGCCETVNRKRNMNEDSYQSSDSNSETNRKLKKIEKQNNNTIKFEDYKYNIDTTQKNIDTQGEFNSPIKDEERVKKAGNSIGRLQENQDNQKDFIFKEIENLKAELNSLRTDQIDLKQLTQSLLTKDQHKINDFADYETQSPEKLKKTANINNFNNEIEHFSHYSQSPEKNKQAIDNNYEATKEILIAKEHPYHEILCLNPVDFKLYVKNKKISENYQSIQFDEIRFIKCVVFLTKNEEINENILRNIVSITPSDSKLELDELEEVLRMYLRIEDLEPSGLLKQIISVLCNESPKRKKIV